MVGGGAVIDDMAGAAQKQCDSDGMTGSRQLVSAQGDKVAGSNRQRPASVLGLVLVTRVKATVRESNCCRLAHGRREGQRRHALASSGAMQQ